MKYAVIALVALTLLSGCWLVQPTKEPPPEVIKERVVTQMEEDGIDPETASVETWQAYYDDAVTQWHEENPDNVDSTLGWVSGALKTVGGPLGALGIALGGLQVLRRRPRRQWLQALISMAPTLANGGRFNIKRAVAHASAALGFDHSPAEDRDADLEYVRQRVERRVAKHAARDAEFAELQHGGKIVDAPAPVTRKASRRKG